MESQHFESCASSGDVWRLSKKCIAIVNLSMGMAADSGYAINDGRVFEMFADGTSHATHFGSASATASASAFARASGGTAKPGPPLGLMLASMMDDPTLNAITPLTTHDENLWAINAWKTFEIIRRDVMVRTELPRNRALGPKGVGWISDEEFDRFGRSVNSPAVSGSAARHAVPDRDDPSVEPMDHSEVQLFVRTLFERWVHWRYTSEL